LTITNLTRSEAAERSRQVSADSYDVQLDLTGDGKTFRSTTTVTFTADIDRTWIDLVAPNLITVVLNGKELDPHEVFNGARIELSGLAANNVLEVAADCRV